MAGSVILRISLFAGGVRGDPGFGDTLFSGLNTSAFSNADAKSGSSVL